MGNTKSGSGKRLAASKQNKKAELTENAVKVLKARYLKKDEKGNVLEEPHQLFDRVAGIMADIEKDYGADKNKIGEVKKDFLAMMEEGRFMPNSPTLMNAGRDMGMLSACFVLPLEDSIDGIFSTVKATALIQKAGGGTGFSFDRLRPTGDYIKTSGGTTSGPISFWKVLSEATNAIQQGAFRRGANMGTMSITHPDIIKFIQAKQNLEYFTNFNISVKITNDWMDDYHQYPDGPQVVTNPRSGISYVIPKGVDEKTYEIADLMEYDEFERVPQAERIDVYSAKEIYNMLIECAWRTGEPGVLFIDEMNKANPTPHIGSIESTNPCGEQPLLPFEACNLGSINVAKFIEKDEYGTVSYDWESLRETIKTSVRFLDNVIDANNYPLPEIEAMSRNNRKIGLGLMGFADALFMLRVPYNSEEGVAFGEKIMKFINDESHEASSELAEERGSFNNWEGSIWDTQYNKKMRNAATTTVAPTGTISIIANCSGGIEPLFSLAFLRNVLNGEQLIEVNDIFKQIAVESGFYSEDLMKKIAETGTLHGIEDIPETIRDVFVCSHDISPDWHVKMQGAFQKHCDSSISKTINLPADATEEDVEKVYSQAWRANCKGITVYRDGCRNAQPMALKKEKEEKKEDVSAEAQLNVNHHQKLTPIHTPSILSAVRIRQNTPFGHMHVTLSVDPKEERELEVFAQLGKAGDVTASDLEAISRLISLYLRIGGSLEQIINQLDGIGSHLSIPTKDGRVMSLADGLGKTLLRYNEAKKMYGLKAILMGEVDFDKLPSLKEINSGASAAPAGIPSIPGLAVAVGNIAKSSANKKDSAMDAFKVKCPECEGGVLTFSEGCVKCMSCGYSKC